MADRVSTPPRTANGVKLAGHLTWGPAFLASFKSLDEIQVLKHVVTNRCQHFPLASIQFCELPLIPPSKPGKLLEFGVRATLLDSSAQFLTMCEKTSPQVLVVFEQALDSTQTYQLLALDPSLPAMQLFYLAHEQKVGSVSDFENQRRILSQVVTGLASAGVSSWTCQTS